MALTADDRRVLEKYRDAVEELGRTRLGQNGFRVSYHVTIGPGCATSGAEVMPDEAELAEFVMCFRHIFEDRERASFRKAADVLLLKADLPPDEARELRDILADWKSAGRDSPMRVNKLRPRHWIETYFYSDRYFHRGTPDERTARESFEAQLGRNFMRALFIDPMMEHARAAIDLAQLAVRVLARHP